MKKITLVLLFLLFLSPAFAKTVQRVKKYDIYKAPALWESNAEWVDVVPEIQSMIDRGWRVVSITAINEVYYQGSQTAYLIVVFEKDD